MATEPRIPPEKERILPLQNGHEEEMNHKGIEMVASICLLRSAADRETFIKLTAGRKRRRMIGCFSEPGKSGSQFLMFYLLYDPVFPTVRK
jgi:hypothetical protein